jgi:hypothetical protein
MRHAIALAFNREQKMALLPKTLPGFETFASALALAFDGVNMGRIHAVGAKV